VFRVGLNPYGLTYTLGLQGAGTPRAHRRPLGLDQFIAFALDLGARVLEIDSRWLLPMTPDERLRLCDRLAAARLLPIVSHGLGHRAGETLDDPIQCTRAIGGSLLRLHLTPVLEGGRAVLGPAWTRLVAHARRTLNEAAPGAAAAGVRLGIEDHQDFGSEELLEMAGEAGTNVGIVFDTGNAFAVGEDPIAFARRVSARVFHLHLKDYRAQFTGEGYRLVRCPVGDGCVPLAEIAELLSRTGRELTASIEPAALEARHIRVFTPGWWHGYPPRDASEFGTALGRLRQRRIADDADYRTPWERGASAEELVAYEREHVQRSADNLQRLGIMDGRR
jgi:sugar phosphate isomerase/epimerase